MSGHIDLDLCLDVLRRHLPDLEEHFHVRSLGVFGSYVRHEEKEGSDLDILVSFAEVPSLLRFLALENHLSDLLGVRVDLVMEDALKPQIGERILSEVVAI
jgi:predicted nucleotidyltransferase